ncbi:hypothetical protein NECAME_19643 [Necator americanus]|uniref:Uncharacterized protein n=1 Tax=Necator americanus TaxID=51031 RepID=W2TRE4_NECAM|nr:hypothetical protein NECAME_19643 [Necator americanus]ETN83701.1 hypothetical protein NECAME_19643 [Necator americanus]
MYSTVKRCLQIVTMQKLLLSSYTDKHIPLQRGQIEDL